MSDTPNESQHGRPGRQQILEPGSWRVQRLGSRLASAAWLLGIWVAVSGSYTVGSFLAGLIAVAAVTLMFRRPAHSEPIHQVRPFMLLLYVGHFARELVLANIEVARAVINPNRVRDTRGILAIPLPPSSRLVGAVLANAVTLTPGTSIVEVSEDPPSFHVHVLHVESVAATRSSIAELHWRLVRALGPAEHLPAAKERARQLRDQVAAERASGNRASGSGVAE